MNNTFSRTIKGHDLQFNRYLYPVRYTVKIDEPDSDGKQYELQKETTGWKLLDMQGYPDWLDDISVEINTAIEENESNLL
jgi:hypothetical protein